LTPVLQGGGGGGGGGGDKNNNNIRVGTRWCETRTFRQRQHEVVQIKTAVQLQQNEYPKSMSLNVSYPHAKDFINTSTLTVTPLDDDVNKQDGSVLIGSMSFMTGAPLFNACCLNSRRAKRHATNLFTKELEDYARAAKIRLDTALKTKEEKKNTL
jgi:hypothetical protein